MLAVFTALAAAAAASSHARQGLSLSSGLTPLTHQSRAPMAFVMPDVAWYDSDAIGWAGSNPPLEGESLGHGWFEQVFIDGMDNFLSCYGLALSLRSTIPFLNGFLLPAAPPIVQDKVLPFLAYISDPWINLFRSKFNYNLVGLDLAVFPAFFGVLFLMGVTEAIGAPLPPHLQPGGGEGARLLSGGESVLELQHREAVERMQLETHREPVRHRRLGECWDEFVHDCERGKDVALRCFFSAKENQNPTGDDLGATRFRLRDADSETGPGKLTKAPSRRTALTAGPGCLPRDFMGGSVKVVHVVAA